MSLADFVGSSVAFAFADFAVAFAVGLAASEDPEVGAGLAEDSGLGTVVPVGVGLGRGDSALGLPVGRPRGCPIGLAVVVERHDGADRRRDRSRDPRERGHPLRREDPAHL